MSIRKVVNADPDSVIPRSVRFMWPQATKGATGSPGSDQAVGGRGGRAGAGAQDQHLGRGLLAAARPGRRRRGRRRRSRWPRRRRGRRSRCSSSRAQRVAVGAAALDPGVDRDALGAGALFDRLQHRHRLGRLVRDRALERQAASAPRQVGGHQGRVLGAGEAQRGVDRAARDLGAGEGQEDLVDGVGSLGAAPAQARAGDQEAAAEAERASARPTRTCSITLAPPP